MSNERVMKEKISRMWRVMDDESRSQSLPLTKQKGALLHNISVGSMLSKKVLSIPGGEELTIETWQLKSVMCFWVLCMRTGSCCVWHVGSGVGRGMSFTIFVLNTLHSLRTFYPQIRVIFSFSLFQGSFRPSPINWWGFTRQLCTSWDFKSMFLDW